MILKLLTMIRRKSIPWVQMWVVFVAMGHVDYVFIKKVVDIIYTFLERLVRLIYLGFVMLMIELGKFRFSISTLLWVNFCIPTSFIVVRFVFFFQPLSTSLQSVIITSTLGLWYSFMFTLVIWIEIILWMMIFILRNLSRWEISMIKIVFFIPNFWKYLLQSLLFAVFFVAWYYFCWLWIIDWAVRSTSFMMNMFTLLIDQQSSNFVTYRCVNVLIRLLWLPIWNSLRSSHFSIRWIMRPTTLILHNS